jgi:hypothetical protein
MRTNLRSKARLLIMMLGMLLAVPAWALASEVDVTSVVDVTTPEGAVTLQPGQSENITINMTISGAQAQSATFEVYRDWQLQANGTFVGSNPQEFPVPPRPPSLPAFHYTTTGTVSVANGVAAGGPHTLTVGVFDITNATGPGGKLAAGDSAT